MYKPVFLVFLLLQYAASVSAQDDDVVADTVTAISKLSEKERSDTAAFDAIIEQKQVVIRTVPKSIVDSLKAADEFWYANAEPAKKTRSKIKQEDGKSVFQQRWFRNLLWVIILTSFIGVVLWYLVASNIFIFRKRAKTLGSEEKADESTDDIFSRNYDREIASATAAGNYRLAVRLWYLQTLKELSERGLIDYRFGRTNQDYVNQLSKHSHYRDFFRLTRNFEYTWYGQFEPSTEAYEMMRSDFVHFQNSLQG